MIIHLDEYRKMNEPHAMARPSYLERTSYEEDLLSTHWNHAEQLMESLHVNWNHATQLVNMASFQTRQELTPALPENLANVNIDHFLDRVYALATQI